MHPNVDESPIHKTFLKPSMLVFDTVYNPEIDAAGQGRPLAQLHDDHRRRDVRPAGDAAVLPVHAARKRPPS